MCDRVVSEYPFLIVYCLDKYKTQRMCDQAVDGCLVALKFIPDWFFTRKMLRNIDNTLHADDDISSVIFEVIKTSFRLFIFFTIRFHKCKKAPKDTKRH